MVRTARFICDRVRRISAHARLRYALLILVAIQMIPIIISVAIVHPDVLRTLLYDQDSEGRLGLPEVVITCKREETAVIALSLIYETCIIAVATILGVFSFKFPKNFNEAKYISFCTFSLLVVWVGLIPTYFTTECRHLPVHHHEFFRSPVLLHLRTKAVYCHLSS